MPRIAYISAQIGSLTTTFVYRDIAGLRAAGAEVYVYSVHHAPGTVFSAEAQAYKDEATHLYNKGRIATLAPMLGAAIGQAFRSPLRFSKTLGIAVRDALFADVPRMADRPKLLWHFAVGCLMARMVQKQKAQHIHANFAHHPTSIAMYAALLSGIPFSFVGHAHDLFMSGSALREKVSRAAFGACSTNFNIRFLVDKKGCDESKLWVMRTGLKMDDFVMLPPKAREVPFRILSIAGLREKKGLQYLIEALKILAGKGEPFVCDIVGEGPLREELQRQIDEANLSERVTLAGAQPYENLRGFYEKADVFVLPNVPAGDKDMDGTPVVLIECAALGLPVVSTKVSGNPEIIEDGEGGILVAPKDSEALAEAIGRLLRDEELGRRFAVSARKKAEMEFGQSANIGKLLERIEGAIGKDG